MNNRRAIPAALVREVKMESGHRCAIPTCKQTPVDLHHIVPWETCQKHEFDNLIALCPNCHRKAHNVTLTENQSRCTSIIFLS
jgi:5-methylcytosine-specific restriction endonuclease McrA